MLKAIKRVFALQADPQVHEPRQLQVAVAVLLHEARRADPEERHEEGDAAERALAEIFGLDRQQCSALLKEGRERAQHLTSFYAPVSTVKREFSLPDRIRLVEHLWRVALAD